MVTLTSWADPRIGALTVAREKSVPHGGPTIRVSELGHWEGKSPSTDGRGSVSRYSLPDMTSEQSASTGDLEDKIETLEEELSEKAAHPLELFFDLVFVFAITQVV